MPVSQKRKQEPKAGTAQGYTAQRGHRWDLDAGSCRVDAPPPTPPPAFHTQGQKGMKGNGGLQHGQPVITARLSPGCVCALGFRQPRPHPGSLNQGCPPGPSAEPQLPVIYPRTLSLFWARVRSVLDQADVSPMAERNDHHLPTRTLWVQGLEGAGPSLGRSTVSTLLSLTGRRGIDEGEDRLLLAPGGVQGRC